VNRVAATLFSLLLFATAAAYGDDDPNTAKGFVAGQVYQFGDIAHVNVFNGNLNVILPLGQTYKVNGGLSYAFTLSYSGNNWAPFGRELHRCTGGDPDICTDDWYSSFQPTRRSNAGLGWLASVGGLIATQLEDDPPPGLDAVAYRGPDSADHVLSNTGVDDTGPGYTSDGVFLRLTSVTDGANTYRDLEFPDGTIKRFQRGDGRLVSIRDHFGNQVTITYSSDAITGAPIWSISDGVRTHTVTFIRLTAGSAPDPTYYYVVKQIDLAAFGTANQAHYVFHYDPDGSGNDRTTMISRRTCVCAPYGDPEIGGSVLVPLLTELTLPDGTSYKPDYNIGNAVDPAAEADTGNLTALKTPTLGSYEWDYQAYMFPHGNQVLQPPFGGIINPPENMNIASGLLEQRLKDASGNKLSVTQYGTRLLTTSTVDAAQAVENSITVIADPLNNTVASRTLNYFNPWNAEGMTQLPNPDPNHPNDIVNPRTAGGVQRFMSSKTYDGSGHLARATFVVYDDQYRVGSQEVVSYDPTASSQRYLNSARTDYSDFDGYGHYRSVATSGDFAGQTAARTVTTAYNKADADVGGTIYDTGTVGGTFHTWPEDRRWLLNLYTSVSVTDGTSAQKSLACFDTETGFLSLTRSMLGTSPNHSHDVMARFTADGAGNVGAEEYFGGDDGVVGSDVGAVPSGALCSVTGLNTTTYPRKYSISHHYTAGSLDKTSYLDPSCQSNCASILDTTDRTIDGRTGLPSASRDPSGLETTFDYDSSGRASTVTPPSDLAATSYAYTPATASANASVKIETRIGTPTNGLTSEYKYDSLGRLILESIVGAGTIPGTGITRYRTTAYDAVGRKQSVSTLDTIPSPTHFTSYVYDALDRPVSVTEPDGSVTSFDYVSEASTTKRTVSVFTSAGNTLAPTKEKHDRQGRLVSLEEPNGTITTYTYDLADHLTSVTMPGENNVIQHRYFTYDGRGFLQSEQHPELGSGGDGTTTYGEYDARGHARHKFTGSSGGTYDLSFAYDSAERLTSISDVARGHTLKVFTFGVANGTGSPTDYRKGKLLTAARFNTMPHVSGDLSVTETYKYENTSGRPSECDTVTKIGATTLQSFKQQFTYDALGAITAPGYPACLSPVPCTIPTLTTATNTYTNGMLTGVVGFASSLGYNNNGTLGTVTHANNVVDTIVPDDHGMTRPKSIGYAAWSVPACTPAFTAQPQSQTISPNTSVTLTVGVSACGTLSYQWYRGNSGDTSNLLQSGASSSYSTGSLSTTTNFWVKVTDSAFPTPLNSNTAVVTAGLCTPVINQQPSPQTVNFGELVVNVHVGVTSDCQELRVFTWYRGAVGDTSNRFYDNHGNATLDSFNIFESTYLWVRIDGQFINTVDSAAALITVNNRPAPVGVNAAVTPNTNNSQITVTWQSVWGSHHYLVKRCSSTGCGTPATVLASSTTYQDANSIAANTTYVYSVASVDSLGSTSPYSAPDLATTMTFTAAQPGLVVTRAHFNELLDGVNRVRAAGGSSPVTWQLILPPGVAIPPAPGQPAGGIIAAAHINSLRTQMNVALSNLGITPLPYTDGLTLPSGTLIRAIYFNELQDRTR
jgi:RHS Repeat.